MRAPDRRPIVTPQLVLGVAALLAGVLLLGANLGYAPARDALRLWPAVLVAVGLVKLVQPGRLWSPTGGIVWLAVGTWMLATNLGVLRTSVWEVARTYWPLLLVVLGLSLVRRTLRHGHEPAAELDRRSDLHVVAILGGNKGASGSQSFRGGELTAILGGVDLDLRETRMQNGRAVLDVFTLWGGLELRVPEGWIVENHMVVALGGYEDHTRPVGSPDAPRLLLRGTTVMGGVEVRH